MPERTEHTSNPHFLLKCLLHAEDLVTILSEQQAMILFEHLQIFLELVCLILELCQLFDVVLQLTVGVREIHYALVDVILKRSQSLLH